MAPAFVLWEKKFNEFICYHSSYTYIPRLVRTSSEFPQITASLGRTTVGVGARQLLERGLVVDNFIAIDLEQHLGLLLGARYILLAPRAGPTTALVFDQQMQALHLIGSITAGAGRFLGRFGWLIPL